MDPIIQILHLEDDPVDVELVQVKLAEADLACRITRVQTRDAFDTVLRRDEVDIILADFRLPVYDGTSALRLAKELRPDVPFIFVSGTMGEEAAIEALTKGATDYVLKQKLSRLAPAVRRALQEARNRREGRQAQEALQRSNMINAARLRLMQFAGTHCLHELLEETVNEAEKITESLIGFYHFVDDDQQSLTLQNWSTRTKARLCKVRGKGLHYPVADAGVWVDCVHERKPVVHNDYLSLPHRRGLPEGHAEVVRQLVVPVLRGEKIKAVLGVGNKPADYSQKDVDAISLLADLVWEIAERKQAEASLAAREHEFRTLAENLPDNIVRYDRQGRTVYVNPALEKVLGAAAEDRIGTRVREFHSNGSYEAYAQAVDDVLDSGENGEIEFIVPVPSKEPIVHQIRMITERDEHGEVTGVLAIGRDITDRKRAEQERQANLKFFESMDKVNRAIQGDNDLEEMMKDLLDVVLSIFDCDRAFLLYPCDPEAAAWQIRIERSRPEHSGISALGLAMPVDKEVSETLRILLNSDGPVKFGPGTVHPLRTDFSERFQLKSFMSMALNPRVGKPWQFGIHQCSHPRVWTAEEERLLQEIGRRLEEGLSSMLAYRNLRESEAEYRQIVDTANEGIWVLGPDTITTFVNARMAEMLGSSVEEIIGRSLTDFMFEVDVPDHVRKMENRRRGMPEYYERRFRHHDGHAVWTHASATPIFDGGHHFNGSFAMFTDITEQKRAEIRLNEQLHFLQQLLDSIPIPVYYKDLEGLYLGCNAAFEAFTGLARKDIVGHSVHEVAQKERADKHHAADLTLLSHPGVQTYEISGIDRDGKHHDVIFNKATFVDANGCVAGTVGALMDITSLRTAEEERKLLQAKLHQTQKMEAVGQLAGGVAHDFNNMLGVIIGYAELALAKTDLDDSLRRNLQGILTAGLRSLEITRQLLAFARKQTITPKILDLNETIEEMLKLLRRLIGEDIDLAWLPGAKLWPVKMDPSQIDQILANLCVNAKDAIAGVGKITIETHKAVFDEAYCAEHKGFHPGEFVMLAVSDNGSGMDKPTLDRIFEPFFTTKGVGRGTGLGLATVYGIVKQNAGFINVYSEPKHGSTFKIYLPRHIVTAEQEPEAGPAPQDMSGDETILVVEDEIEHLRMVKLILESYGYQVLTASSPGEALLAAKKHTGEIHLLLTDLIMPEMNGRDLSREMTFLYPDIACLFMSGYTNDVIAHHNVLDKGVYFIQKPFSTQALAAKVRQVLDAG